MKLIYRYSFLICILIATGNVLQAQENPDLLLKAMQDEMNRSMTDLRLPDHDKPFYIMYGLIDQKRYTVSATLGSIEESKVEPQRFKTNTRILVGDYSFNDESLEDNLFSNPTVSEIELPVDNDYHGIRRAFWSTTDKVYRDAARHFKKHQETLKESGKALADIPHRSFAKSEPVTLFSALTPLAYDKNALEAKAKNLSAIFLKHPSIENSRVYFDHVEGYRYIVTTEGTTVKVPFSYATFVAAAQSKNEQGEFVMEQVSKVSCSLDKLPSEKELAEEVEKLIAKFEEKEELKSFEEEYTGPVILMGSSVGNLFGQVLFGGREGIVANDNIPRLQGYRFNNENAMDTKIGKLLYGDGLTVKVRPKMKSYKGVDLLGSFEIDDEGIVPADEVTVIENGVLKVLLNNRTITHPSQTANGFSSGPGVIEIILKHRQAEKELKTKLIEKAKTEGLEYAVIVRDSPAMGIGATKVYKVYTADGREELVKDAYFNASGVKSLKRIAGASEKYSAHNIAGPNRGGGVLGAGTFISFITPDAILLDEAEIKPFRMPYMNEEQEYVSNPLKQ